MILIDLLFTFMKIGLFSFGGGYGMLPLMEREVLEHGWMSSEQFVDFVAVSESTPGPIAINMATFIGSAQGGFLGAMFATLGVIIPSVIIILLIVAVFKGFLQSKIVSSALKGVKPVIVGLIFTTGVWLAVRNFLPNIGALSAEGFSLAPLLITAGLGAAYIGYKLLFRKNPSPIMLIIVSAIVGIIVF